MLEVLRYIHTKDQSNAMSMSKQCRRCPRYTTLLKDFNALNSMYVKGVEDGVCGFYTALTAHRVLLLISLMLKVSKMSNTMYSVYTAASCTCQEGRLYVTVQYLKSLPSWGFSDSPPISLRRQLCSLSWTCQLQG